MKKRIIKKMVALFVSTALFVSAIPVSAKEHTVTEDDITKAVLEIAFPEGTALDFEVKECSADPLSRSATGEKMLVATETNGDEVTVTTVLPLRIDGSTLSNPYFNETIQWVEDEYANLAIVSSFNFDRMASLHNGNLYRAKSCTFYWRANTSAVSVKTLTCDMSIKGNRYTDAVYDAPFGDSCLVESNYLANSFKTVTTPPAGQKYENIRTMPAMNYWVKFTDYMGNHGLFAYRSATYSIAGGVQDQKYEYGTYIIPSGL